MKIQSRPTISSALSEGAMAVFLRNIMEICGNNTSDVYRKVLAEGATAMWLQMEVISDFQVSFSNRGYYGIAVDVRMPDGEIRYLHI